MKYSVISVGGNQAMLHSGNAREFLAEMKGMTPVQVDAVLDGVPTIIQQGIDAETAQALAETMKEIGLKCHVVEQNPASNLSLVDSSSAADEQPGTSAEAAREQSHYRRDDIMSGFHEEVNPLRLSLAEKIQMSVLATAMLAVPGLFIAFVMGLMTLAFMLSESAFAAWFAGQQELPVLQWGGAFLVLGFTSVLIHRAIGDWRREKKFVHLDRDRHPQIYTLVEKIAEITGVKAPVSIKLDAEVGLVLRPKEFFCPPSGYRSELIIGLPLFYSLNVRQLSGVIAHAFSAFSRDACRYGYPMISIINGWLYRCTNYQLDTDTLTFSKNRHARSPLSYLVLIPADFLARLFFKLLYLIGSALTFSLSRKMDMQADLQSAQIAGSTEFRSTQFRLRALHYGQLHAESDSFERMNSGDLVSNYSAFVVDYAEALRIELQPTLINEMEQLVTPLTRSRVVDLGRIVNVEKYQFEGSCFLLGPAVDLLTDVNSLSREVTRRHYAMMGYPDYVQSEGNNVASLAARQKDSLGYTLFGWQKSGRYLRFDDFYSYESLSIHAKCQDLRDLVAKLNATEDQLTALASRYAQADERANQLHVKKTLQEAGVDFTNQQMLEEGPDLRETETAWLKTLNQQGVLRGDLTYYEALISQRIALALSLAKQTPDLKNHIQVGDFEEYIDYLKDSAAFLYKTYESVARLRTYTYTLGALVNAGQIEHRSRLQPYFNRYDNYCRVELESILNVLGAVAYPLTLPAGMRDNLEHPSIAEVLRYSVKGIEQPDKSVSLCFKVCHSTLKFLDGFTRELMEEFDKLVYATERQYGIVEQ
ncbi:MAG: M48 family metallopeptidase [Ketobacteraceae bacterium]|nr:M48 family metallopeptidase [Ketobacteraceae bacterium]